MPYLRILYKPTKLRKALAEICKSKNTCVKCEAFSFCHAIDFRADNVLKRLEAKGIGIGIPIEDYEEVRT